MDRESTQEKAVNKDEIRRLAKNQAFIRGAYNRCDRWRGRCAFTSRSVGML